MVHLAIRDDDVSTVYHSADSLTKPLSSSSLHSPSVIQPHSASPIAHSLSNTLQSQPIFTPTLIGGGNTRYHAFFAPNETEEVVRGSSMEGVYSSDLGVTSSCSTRATEKGKIRSALGIEGNAVASAACNYHQISCSQAGCMTAQSTSEWSWRASGQASGYTPGRRENPFDQMDADNWSDLSDCSEGEGPRASNEAKAWRD